VSENLKVLAMVAESNPTSAAPAPGKACRSPSHRPTSRQTSKLSKSQEAHLVSLYKGGHHTTAETAELFKAARSMTYRILQRTTS
jgi:hypothetical protein